jgi:hypothetical protein
VVTNWDGLDAKAFAGIYKSNWVCSVLSILCTENPFYAFPEIKLRGLDPDFYMQRFEMLPITELYAECNPF